METFPYSQIEKGTFMIATPELAGGIFFRAVVLVCEHNANGSFGLIINKSLDFDLPEEILNSNQIINPHIGIRAGGPVQTNQMMLLHNCPDIPQQTLQVCPGVFLGGDLRFLQEVVTQEDGPNIHLCFGYAGWGAGQLEREFLDSHWFVHPASEKLLFTVPPEKLWSTLLREMGGKYAPLSMIPEDLSMN